MNINIAEQFEALEHAPIVEAVIEIRGIAGSNWTEDAIIPLLKPKLPEYTKAVSRSGLRHQFKLNQSEPPSATRESLGWHGLVMQLPDERQSVQFNRDAFVFSRLNPYEGWSQFVSEAKRLWSLHVEVAKPVSVERIGLRFINRIPLHPKSSQLEDYLQPYPEAPFDLDLPFVGFFHHDTFAVPEKPYAINVTRTLQPSTNPQAEPPSIILDIDAFTTIPFDPTAKVFEENLPEMRWLKNKAFFGSITKTILEQFR